MANTQVLEIAIKTMREARSLAEAQKAEVEERIDGLSSAIKALEKQLAAQAENPPIRRAKKGENLAAVKAFFMQHPDGSGFTLSQIARALELAVTSVQAVLASEEFMQKDGAWFLKPEFRDELPV